MSWHAEMWVRLDMLEIADHSKCRFNWTVFSNAEWVSVKFSLPHIYTLPYFMWKMCSPSRRENHFFCDVMNCNKYPFIASIFVWIGYLPGISPIPFAQNESKEKKRKKKTLLTLYIRPQTTQQLSRLCLHADKLNEMLACLSAVLANQRRAISNNLTVRLFGFMTIAANWSKHQFVFTFKCLVFFFFIVF